jgi:S-adenosyl-L-methionine hydrolase (adenosine-forming)
VARRHDTVSFLSDFGTVDGAPAHITSIIRDLAPHARVIDLTHEVAPFDIRGGSLTLARSVPHVAAGVILAVVDPGAGAGRPPVAIEVADGAGVFVGPDNGLLAPAVAMAGSAERAVLLDDAEYHLAVVSPTSGARDVLAPVVAHLCNGVDLGELGTSVDPGLLVPGVVPLPRDEDGSLLCEVLWVDRFGNVQLNVSPEELTDRWDVGTGSLVRVTTVDALGNPHVRSAALVDAFAGLANGAVGMLRDGHGMCSLVVDRASAAVELGLAPGGLVVLAPLVDDEGPSTSPDTPVVTNVALRRKG